MEKFASKQISQPINQSFNQSIIQPISQSIIQPINHSINQSTNQSFIQPIRQLINRTNDQSTTQSIRNGLRTERFHKGTYAVILAAARSWHRIMSSYVFSQDGGTLMDANRANVSMKNFSTPIDQRSADVRGGRKKISVHGLGLSLRASSVTCSNCNRCSFRARRTAKHANSTLGLLGLSYITAENISRCYRKKIQKRAAFSLQIPVLKRK